MHPNDYVILESILSGRATTLVTSIYRRLGAREANVRLKTITAAVQEVSIDAAIESVESVVY